MAPRMVISQRGLSAPAWHMRLVTGVYFLPLGLQRGVTGRCEIHQNSKHSSSQMSKNLPQGNNEKCVPRFMNEGGHPRAVHNIRDSERPAMGEW